MKNKIKRLMLGIAAGAALLHFSVLGQVQAVSSPPVTSESIREKEEEISRIKEEKETLKNGLSNLKDIKKELEKQKNNLAEYVRQLDNNLAVIEENIAELNDKIQVKEGEIQQAEIDLEAAFEKEENQKESTIACIRLMYEAGNPSIVDMLMEAKGFGEFLNRADYVEKVYVYGQQMWQNYKAAREYVELCKEQLELEKEILDETRESVQVEQRNLEELIEQKTRDIIAYDSDINNKEKAIREYEEEIRAQEEEIKLLEQAVAEEKKKLLASMVITYDGGMFKFPLATYTRISSD